MNELAEKFLKNQDETSAVELVRYARCNNLFNLGCMLSKFLENIYPHSLDIKTEYGVMLYYNKEYESSYEKFESILSMRGLTKEQAKLAIFNQHFSINNIKDKYIPKLDDYIVKQILDRKKKPLPLVTFTITSCKRFNLFVNTINSFVRCCKDIDLIDEWFCVDDNSSEEDRKEMQRLYPFIKFYFKSKEEKGHPQSMNIIRKYVKTPYTLHMEDDWKFFECRNYISECLEVLGCDSKIGQCLINKNYAETAENHNIIGGEFKMTSSGLRYYIHEYCKTDKEKEDFVKRHGYGNSSSYWPHFSFRPSLLRTKIYQELGEFNQTISHFEMDYSYKYAAKGYISAFLENVYCLHIGRLTSERNNKNIPNAYELNDEAQLSGKEEQLKKKQEKQENSEQSIRLKTFVVNLDRRPDRMKKFSEQTEPNFLKYNRFSAVDGARLIPTSQLQQIFENNDYNMRSGMVGCAMSHVKLYVQLLQDNESDAYCIFEDDIEFVPKFQDKFLHCINQLQKTKWDLFYLGHTLYSRFINDKVYDKETIPVIEQFSREKSLQMSMGGAFGYIITKNGVEKLLNFINQHGMTNAIDTMQQKFANTLNVFYSYPHLVHTECYRNDAVKTVDTDIQLNFTSLTLPFDKRLEEELKYYDNIRRLETLEDVNLYKPCYYRSDNKDEIRKFASTCKYLCYTIEDRALFIVPNGDNGRFFHRFKKNGIWNVDDAIKYKKESVDGIILVLSCQKHMETRLKEFKLNNDWYGRWKVIYVIGDLFLDTDYKMDGNTMWLKCEDSYIHLLKKLILSIKYLYQIYDIKEGILRAGDDLVYNYNILENFLSTQNKQDFIGRNPWTMHEGLPVSKINDELLKRTVSDPFMVNYYLSHPEDFNNPQHNLKGVDISKYMKRPEFGGPAGVLYYISNRSCKILVDHFESINRDIFHYDEKTQSYPYTIEDCAVSHILYRNYIGFVNTEYMFSQNPSTTAIAYHTNKYK